jgi:hypothetical protein
MLTFPVASQTTGAPLGCIPKVMVAPDGTLTVVYLNTTAHCWASYTPRPATGLGQSQRQGSLSIPPASQSHSDAARLRSTTVVIAGLNAPSVPSDPLSHCAHTGETDNDTANTARPLKLRRDMMTTPLSKSS